MEQLGFFIFLLTVCLIVLPIVAMVKVRSVQKDLAEVMARIRRLESELRQLRDRYRSFTDETLRTERQKPATTPSSDPPPLAAVVKEEVRERRTADRVAGTEETPAWLEVPAVDSPPVVSSVETVGSHLKLRQVSSGREEAGDSTKAKSNREEILKLRLASINWEQFMGVRLFAWLGGFALFLAVAFFVKYSFDHDLIPPEIRVAIGFLLGVGLLAGGVKMSSKPYKVTAHTLSGAGVVILYAVTFACRAVYHFALFGPIPTGLLMVLITVTAFFVSVRLDALFVAVLGMLGGFLTPILISTGQDNPAGLFTYIALLDIGLFCVASVRRWDWLNLAAAIGTVLVQFGWVAEFFEAEKTWIAMAVFLMFDALALGGFVWARRKERLNRWITAAALLLPVATLAFVFVLIANSTTGARPGVIFSFILGADVCILFLTVLDNRLRNLHLIAGAVVFFQLAVWTMARVSDPLLYWALAGYFVFAVVHAAFPVWINRRFAVRPVSPLCHLFPLVALGLTLIPMFKLGPLPFLIWPVILLLNIAAFGLALVTASVAGLLFPLLATAVIAFVWLARIPGEIAGLAGILVVIGGFAAVFATVGIYAGRIIVARQEKSGSGGDAGLLPTGWVGSEVQRQIPALSGIMPFLLLILVVERVPLENPSPIFGMAFLLSALLLGLARIARLDWLPAIALGGAYLTEFRWHYTQMQPAGAGAALGWYLFFYAVFAGFPFVFQKGDGDRIVSWVCAAISGPVHFYLIYTLIRQTWPNHWMGVIPALFAVPTLGGVVLALRQIPSGHGKRNAILAWFGGVTLLFITLIFPIQFERQWLTIAWGLEGVALFWLFHRVPHHGLRYVGAGLLGVAFVRLALNPAVLEYHARAATPGFNWYLYTYGIVIGCLFVSPRLLSPPDHLIRGRDPRPWLRALGTVLTFLLLNIEIADAFETPGTRALTFSFGRSLALDLSYSIAWGLFALALLIIGILHRLKAARYAGLALLGVTLLKLFLHDLAALNQLYRVAALVGVATIAIVASFLYQKFLVSNVDPETRRRGSVSGEDS